MISTDRKRVPRVVVVPVLFVLFLPSVRGQAESLRYLDELVVTGTRSEEPLYETPVRTEVVTSEELQKTHARNVREALESVPGVQLREVHGKSGYEVWMQGIEADRVLILLDGLPMTATTGSAVDVSQLSVLDVERIEVVKGAVSAQYGSAGIGGVLNVISRPVAPGLRGEVTVDAGTYGEQNPSGESREAGRYSTRASIEGGSGSLAGRLSVATEHTDGVDPEPETWSRPGDEVDRQQVRASLDWTPARGHRLNLVADLFEEDSDSRFVEVVPPNSVDLGKSEEVRRQRWLLRGEHDPGSGLKGGWSLLREDLSDDSGKYSATSHFDIRESEQTLSRLSAYLGAPLGSRHELLAGVDLQENRLRQLKDGSSELDGSGTFEHQTREFWLQDTWLPGTSVEIVSGVRAQHDTDFGSHVAPKVNARVDFAPARELEAFLRAGVGAGYRAPNLKERHYRFDHSSLGYVVEGNEDLTPEKSVSYQLGGGLRFRRAFWAEGNLFFNDIRDLIQTRLLLDAASNPDGSWDVYGYDNVAKARTWGLEATAGWEPGGDWRLQLGYTLTRTRDEDTGYELTNRPRHQARLALDGPLALPGLTWSARVRYQSDEYVDSRETYRSPGYTTVDLKLSYQIGPQIRVFAGADNLTDVQRDFSADTDFRPVAGRFLYTGIFVAFGE